MAVALGLGEHALARIDQDHCGIGGRGAGDHVAGILFVARRVGDDELARLGGEEAISDVDRDALLTLGREPVDEEREVERFALRALLLAVAGECRNLIVEQQLRIVEQPSDQRRLAVIDAAAGDEAQQRLALARLDPAVECFRGDLRGIGGLEQGGHQK